MRRRGLIFAALLFLALAAAWAGWAIKAGAKLGWGWRGLGEAWPYLFAGVLTVAGVIVGFVWLASFSERRGYDDRAHFDDRPAGRHRPPD